MMKRYLLEFTRKGEKLFLSLPKTIRERIKEKVEFFVHSGTPLLFAKKLEGREDVYRFRVGDYRIIFTQKPSGELVILLILSVGHRKEIYLDS